MLIILWAAILNMQNLAPLAGLISNSSGSGGLVHSFGKGGLPNAVRCGRMDELYGVTWCQ
jgi:hypothetical protein